MITKGSFNKSNCAKNQLFFNSARHGFELLIKAVMKNQSDIILMPGYIGESAKEGSGVFDPIRDTKVKYEFYKIHADLSVDMEDIKSKMDSTNVKAILLIHWFGFPQKCVFELKELCNKKGVTLIEDCAHTINGYYKGRRLGSIGDYALFSIHKILTTENGGMLQINNIANMQIFAGERENIDFSDLLQYAKTDLDKIAEKKLRNYNAYLKYLDKDSDLFDIIYPELEEGIVPNNFPVFIKNYNRFQFYNELEAMGIPTVVLYYRMIEELSKDEFPVSYEIADTILNLPIHQDIEIEDVKHIAEVLNNYKH